MEFDLAWERKHDYYSKNAVKDSWKKYSKQS